MRDLKDILNQVLIDRKLIKESESGGYSYEAVRDTTDYQKKYEQALANYKLAQTQHEEALKAWDNIPPDIIRKAQGLQRKWAETHGGEIRPMAEFFDQSVDGMEDVWVDPATSDYYKNSLDHVSNKETEKRRYRQIQSDIFTTSAAVNEALGKMVKAKADLDSKKEFLEYRNEEHLKKDFNKYAKMPFIVGGMFGLIGVHIILTTVLMVIGIMKLQPGYFNSNFMYLVFWFVFPIGIWIWSTAYDYWNYLNRKMATLYLCVTSILLLIQSQLTKMFYSLFVPVIFKFIKPTSQVSTDMIVRLSRLMMFLPAFAITAFGFVWIRAVIQTDTSQEAIKHYKVLRGKDTRKDTQFKYDVTAVRNLETGKRYTIKEKDRFLHMYISGASGTGKTSSVINSMLEADLTQVMHNLDWQKTQVTELLDQGIVRLKKNFKDTEFTAEYIEPVYTEDEKENVRRAKLLDQIKQKAPEAGILVIAPNEELSDNTYELAKARGLRVMRVDPMRGENSKPKEGAIGFNPLYISPLIEGMDKFDDIVNKATIVADVLQFLSEKSGKVDAYFAGVNSIQTITACKLLMLTYPSIHNGKQPTLKDVQRLLNSKNYEAMKPYLFELIHLFGNHGQPKALPDGFDDETIYPEQRRESWIKDEGIDCGLWQDVFTVINYELLDKELGKQQYERANGLRNQLNLFLNTPRVSEVMCTEETIDLDRFLADGGVLTFNYALSLGASTSMAFGQFFVLSYSKAVLRRPRHRYCRPVFCYIDELPTLISGGAGSALEELWSLHRQYNCGNIVAFQNLQQMNKTEVTKYLKDVLISNCAHKIVFGRITPDEMKIYETYGGKRKEAQEQTSVSQTSLSTSNPNYTYTTRTSMQDTNCLSGSEMAYRDFRECTVFTVDDGTPLYGFPGKVDFLQSSEWLGHRHVAIRWEKWYRELPEYHFKAPKSNIRLGNVIGSSDGIPQPKKASIRLSAHGQVINASTQIIPETVNRPRLVETAENPLSEETSEQEDVKPINKDTKHTAGITPGGIDRLWEETGGLEEEA